jgi:glycosyltransferase involved in cell wall biosynthesis
VNIILVTIADLPEGGGNTYYLRMVVRALVRIGHQVTIWNEHALGIAPPQALQIEGSWEGGTYRYVLDATARSSGFGSIREKLRAVRIMGQWLEKARAEKKVDVLWFNNLTFYNTWWLTRKAHQLGIATIQFYQDERQELVSTGSRSLSRRLFALNSRLGDRICPRQADALVVVSNYLKDKYRKLAGSEVPLHILSTIVDCDAWKCPPETDGETPRVLYAGAFGEQDEIEGLVDALGMLKSRGRSFQAVLLGDNKRDPDRMNSVREQIRRQGLSDCVDMPGFVPWNEVRRQIGNSHVLINIRRDDVWSHSGFSVKLGEYLASGRSVIATSVGDVGRFLKDGESAVLLRPGPSSDEIVRALEKVLESAAKRRQIGENGWKVAKAHFDLPVAAKVLDGALYDAAARRAN